MECTFVESSTVEHKYCGGCFVVGKISKNLINNCKTITKELGKLGVRIPVCSGQLSGRGNFFC